MRFLIGVVVAGLIFFGMIIHSSYRISQREQRIQKSVKDLGGYCELNFAEPAWFWQATQQLPFSDTFCFRVSYIDLSHADSAACSKLLPELESLQDLQYLTIGGMSGTGIERLKKLKELDSLLLPNAEVSDAGLIHLKDYPHLTDFILMDAPVSDAGMRLIGECKSIRILGLNNTQVTDQGLAHLKDLPNLQILQLAGTHITDKGMEQVAALSTLVELTMLCDVT